MSGHSQELGTKPIGSLLRQQSIPASVGFLILSIYQIVDTIFVGHYIGTAAIGAITVVMPLSFLIGSIGMSIGVGGASVISRALGEDNELKANRTFGNQIGLSVVLGLIFTILGYTFTREILVAFGAIGNILEPAVTYFHTLLYGLPFIVLAMMSNNVIRAEGNAKVAMLILVTPAVTNIALDAWFIVGLDMGIAGAAWATAISYMASFGAAVVYFTFGKSELKLKLAYLIPNAPIVKEIFAIGSISLVRQGTISMLSLVLNHTLGKYSGELGIAVWGIVNRVSMFMLFPVIGVMQGFMPIAGYNYGAKKYGRVREVINKAMLSGVIISGCILIGVFAFAPQITAIFTDDPELIAQSPFAMRMVFLLVPLVAVQMIGAAYFQSLGKAWPALFLTLSKQGFFLIPLVYLLPMSFGLDGVWYAFPIADVLSAGITFWYLRREIRLNLKPKEALQVQP